MTRGARYALEMEFRRWYRRALARARRQTPLTQIARTYATFAIGAELKRSLLNPSFLAKDGGWYFEVRR